MPRGDPAALARALHAVLNDPSGWREAAAARASPCEVHVRRRRSGAGVGRLVPRSTFMTAAQPQRFRPSASSFRYGTGRRGFAM